MQFPWKLKIPVLQLWSSGTIKYSNTTHNYTRTEQQKNDNIQNCFVKNAGF